MTEITKQQILDAFGITEQEMAEFEANDQGYAVARAAADAERAEFRAALTATMRHECEPVGAMGRSCAVHTHAAIVPLEVHHVWPLGMGGPDSPANKVTLCSNGHSAVHDLLSKMLAGKAPWSVRIHYGWRINRIAKTGYTLVKANGGMS